MVITKERITQDIATLSDFQLREVAEFLEYLKFKEKSKRSQEFDEIKLAELYREFSAEDSDLAESDFVDYAESLNFEDKK